MFGDLLASVNAAASTIADNATTSPGKDTDDARGMASNPATALLQIISFSRYLVTTVRH